MTTAVPDLRVSIIIPAHNEEAVIERCVSAALTQSVPAYEVIVVDNRSSDRTAEIAQRLAAKADGVPVRVVAQHQSAGLVPTRNAGFEAATGDVYGRIDADSVIRPDWVAQLTARLRDPAIAAVTGPVTYADLPLRRVGGLVDDLARRALLRLGTAYPFLYGSNMAIRARAWERIRAEACTDPSDRMHEDIDLAIHLFDAGLPVAYTPALRASVSARRLDDSATDFRDYTRRFGRTYAHHGIDLWYLKAPQLLFQSLYWPLRMIRGLRHRTGALT